MQQLQLGDQVILYDRARTQDAYARMEIGDVERCGCAYCRNFGAQRGVVYPENFRQTLKLLGIDPNKEGEIYECGSEGSLWRYDGWFYLSGELLEPGERLTDAGSGFHFYFVDAKRLPKPASDFGENVLAVEFCGAKLPWVIAEQP
jgi:hypothetical protein